ncbi:hypothetical protein P692DRAFT_20826337 [Suillus brevipes Sb2]|nr:hypothetical protein P692DRAFT_20826337 [Suillus brevipes Sb2]
MVQSHHDPFPRIVWAVCSEALSYAKAGDRDIIRGSDGKSTLGATSSKALHLPFINHGHLHPQSHVVAWKPLTDTDRLFWLRKMALAGVFDQLWDDHGLHAMPETEKIFTECESMWHGSGVVGGRVLRLGRGWQRVDSVAD